VRSGAHNHANSVAGAGFRLLEASVFFRRGVPVGARWLGEAART
jgi:hypothetical protein